MHTDIPSYIVRVSRAKMPGSCWGTYYRIGVLEVDPGVEFAAAIDTRCSGVRRIITTWENLNAGIRPFTGGRCATARALAEARSLAEECNAGAAVVRAFAGLVSR